MGKIVEIVKLCRPWQWYKNLVIYLALIFTSQLFIADKLLVITLGLISLCFVSSANYVLNDLIDRKKDRQNPEKKKRPLAAGKVEVHEAVLVALFLLVSGLAMAYFLGLAFFGSVVFLFLFTQMYSLMLKNSVFVDVLSIGINFVVRAVAGALLIDVRISPWLILCTFFLSLFLSAGKRASEVRLLGKAASKHRSVLRGYTKEVTDMLIVVTTTLLIISYSLYSFFSDFSWLLVTIPFALYTILRYMYLTHTGSAIARNPELVVKDWKMVAGVVLWTVAVVAVIYMG